jgi:hypothetical protein
MFKTSLVIGSVLAAALASSYVLADQFQMTFGWTAPVYQPYDTPSYDVKYKIAGGAEVVLPPLTVAGGSVVIEAAPGVPVQVSARNVNGALVSAWTPWVTATTPFDATVPGMPNGLTITITRV